MVVLFSFSACNNEWEEEQYQNFISFKAPINDNGVTKIYIKYNAKGLVNYKLPLIVSGSNTNANNVTVHVAVDPDTLKTLNIERFQSRTDLYYNELTSQYFTFPETVDIKAGENTSLMDIDFSLKGIDLSEKWVLPITILDDPSYNYVSHPRKNYRKALLRIMPFNDYSGVYGGTAYKNFLKGYENDAAIVASEITGYVSDENTIFFYAGTIDEDRKDRRNYKIFVHFDNDTKQLTMYAENPEMEFKLNKQPYFKIQESMDPTLPYLKHRYVTIDNIDYDFTDYTSVPGSRINYVVRGSLTLERKINTQIPDEDQAIEW